MKVKIVALGRGVQDGAKKIILCCNIKNQTRRRLEYNDISEGIMITNWQPLRDTKAKIVRLLFSNRGRYITVDELASQINIKPISIVANIHKIRNIYGKNSIQSAYGLGYKVT